MEFKQVLGRRRSIRFFQPFRPVEPEKIQTILEAARIASCAMNANYLRAVVVERESVSPEILDRITTPASATTYSLAPVFIFFFGDSQRIAETKGATLHELIDVGALNSTHGWSHAFIDQFIYPQILEPMTGSPEALIKSVALDCGVASCQALLTAFDEGLGACFSGFNGAAVKEILEVPDHWLPIYGLLVGYPAESLDAGGQRPRMPFEELFFKGKYGVPLERDPRVVERLEREGLLQPPAPQPWRKTEVRMLARMFGLPE